jgi:hypothetical protein
MAANQHENDSPLTAATRTNDILPRHSTRHSLIHRDRVRDTQHSCTCLQDIPHNAFTTHAGGGGPLNRRLPACRPSLV